MSAADPIAGRRAEAYTALKRHFAQTLPFSFTSWNLASRRLTSYDEQARYLLDTPTMDTVGSWEDYFSTENVVREDTREKLEKSLVRANEVAGGFLAMLFQNAELHLTIVSKVGRLKNLYLRSTILRDAGGYPREVLCCMWDITELGLPGNVVGGYTLGRDERSLVPYASAQVKVEPMQTSPPPSAVSSFGTPPDAHMRVGVMERNASPPPSAEGEVHVDGSWQKLCHTWEWTKIRRMTNMHEKTQERKRRRRSTVHSIESLPHVAEGCAAVGGVPAAAAARESSPVTEL